MRKIAFSIMLAAVSQPALAQGNAGFSVGDLHATHEVLQKRANTTSMLEAPGSSFSELSKKTRGWIAEETKRQIESPRPITEVAASVHVALEEDARDIARKHRIDPLDVTRVVTLLIMVEAEDDLAKALRKAKKSGDEAAQAAAERRLAQARVNRKEAFSMQSQVSLALAMM